jgi:hypothetical protein
MSLYFYVLWTFGLFYGHLVYFIDIWSIFMDIWSFPRTFGLVYGHLIYFLVYFPPFGYIVPRKIWQPCWHPGILLAVLVFLKWPPISCPKPCETIAKVVLDRAGSGPGLNLGFLLHNPKTQAHVGLVLGLSCPDPESVNQSRPAKAQACSIKPKSDPSLHFTGPTRP